MNELDFLDFRLLLSGSPHKGTGTHGDPRISVKCFFLRKHLSARYTSMIRAHINSQPL